MIQIKSGTCGTSQGYKTRADGELSLPISEEARLVARGVAKYVTRPIIGAASGVATPNRAYLNAGQGEDADEDNLLADGVETGFADLTDCLDIVDGHFTKESLMKMGRKEMEALASDFSVDVSKCRNKTEIANLLFEVEIEAIEIQPEDGNGSDVPDLTTEEPM